MTQFFKKIKNSANTIKQAFPTEMNVVNALAFINFMAAGVSAQSSTGAAQDSGGINWFYRDTNGMIASGVGVLFFLGLYYCSRSRRLPQERVPAPDAVPRLEGISMNSLSPEAQVVGAESKETQVRTPLLSSHVSNASAISYGSVVISMPQSAQSADKATDSDSDDDQTGYHTPPESDGESAPTRSM